ncbi:CDP-diacylglycerol--serine O-phosphatidyltransferase [Anaerolineales bacterium HSG6]|nr:CDP-diacylglycerol--serine O-phosphatidyltransferase [Anaerolineales bacterium HSG6]MDM8530971.1 CDP-diacylglycerol--serine O-phosphatidyltransferase [Anaerolineales bacterium HSG25]
MPRQITLILPSIATLSSLMFGTVAIMVLSDKEFLLAATLILLGSILDVLDGQLAQRLEAVSDIGKELDSLADVVTFGVAPTILLYHLMLEVGVIQPVAILSSLAFVVAGAFRLARFNTTPSNRSAYFQGMPIPMGSILLITGSFWQGWAINIWWTIVVVTVSYLMVSPFAYPKVKHITNYPPTAWAGVCAFALLTGIVGSWQAVPFALMLLYAVSGPIFSVWFAKTKNKATSK